MSARESAASSSEAYRPERKSLTWATWSAALRSASPACAGTYSPLMAEVSKVSSRLRAAESSAELAANFVTPVKG